MCCTFHARAILLGGVICAALSATAAGTLLESGSLLVNPGAETLTALHARGVLGDFDRVISSWLHTDECCQKRRSLLL